jgi:hypothetical protein
MASPLSGLFVPIKDFPISLQVLGEYLALLLCPFSPEDIVHVATSRRASPVEQRPQASVSKRILMIGGGNSTEKPGLIAV